MKTKIKFFTLLLITIPFLFISCGDDNDGDTISPVINLITPVEGAILNIGESIALELELSDNEMLASYKVDIHNNFTGHNHGKSLKSEGETVAFSFQKSWSVLDQKNIVIEHNEIVIPNNATPGDYHLMIYCTDKAGNESYIARNIELSHEGEVHGH